MDDNTKELVLMLVGTTSENTDLKAKVEELRMDIVKMDEDSKDMIYEIIDACCSCADYEKRLAKKICAIIDYDMEENEDA